MLLFILFINSCIHSSVHGLIFQRNRVVSANNQVDSFRMAKSVSMESTENQPSSTDGENGTTESLLHVTPLFDFTNSETVEKFERIDDAIMGGISTSSIRSRINPDDLSSFASWSGICRVDGGGFCGTRTLPFREPLLISKESEGFYLEGRLVSDDEPHRRVWKLSTRTDRSRGEQLYQAEFQIPSSTQDWTRIFIPFSDFRMVRGARYVPEGKAMNVTEQGIYQIGLTLSKFRLAENMTVIENFRPGYFEMHIKSLGVYSKSANQNLASSDVVSSPVTLSKEDMVKSRPLLLKILFPIFKILFFTEESNRRKRTMMILKKERKMSRVEAIAFGIRLRSHTSGLAVSTLEALVILAMDILRSISSKTLRYAIFLPISGVSKVMKSFSKQNRNSTVK
jgi:Complex I intermediate-associated protein 30 (CIA30)